jgi:hypothetical protein
LFTIQFYQTEAASPFEPVTFDVSKDEHSQRFNADRHDRPRCTEVFRYTDAMRLLRHNHVLTLESFISQKKEQRSSRPVTAFWACYHDAEQQLTRHVRPPLIPLKLVLDHCENRLNLTFLRHSVNSDNSVSAVFASKSFRSRTTEFVLRQRTPPVEFLLYTPSGEFCEGPYPRPDACILATELATALSFRVAETPSAGTA